MSEKTATRRLSDLIAIRHPHANDPKPIPNPGTIETCALETIDNDKMAWFLGVLPAA